MNILSLFVIVPVLMLAGLWASRNLTQVKTTMVAGASILLALSVYLTIEYINLREAGAQGDMLFTSSIPWFEPLNICYSVGVDGISVVMLLLSSVIVFTGIFASWKLQPLTKEYFMWFTLLSTGVYGFFISTDLFTMFMFYEVALIPMYLLIGVWGSGKKEYAAMKLTLMLMGGSAFLLVGILGIFYGAGGETMNLLEIAHKSIPAEIQHIFFPLVFLGFGVLGALFPFHTWSPDGHASAPTAVSMLHAGVLMKLGGYGCFRVAIYLLPEGAAMWGDLFLILTTISVVYGAFSAVVQTDLKYINAYSSVSHCGLVLFAILMLTRTSCTGAIIQMLSHGLMTALFFALIGMIYGRTHTRDIRNLRGLMKIMPFLAVGYIIAGFANLGLPGFSGFVAEMTIFVGSFEVNDTFHRVCTIIATTSIVITAVYILRVVGKIMYGVPTNEEHLKLTDATWDEKVAVIFLIVCVAGIGTAPWWISDLISNSVAPIISSLK
ncbi:complex I subunit 4 family protein [Phocaeicola paurosaccharolyticus]|jgi:NADH-quinone oxidoreductase subunit M|uniref:complex I subunit 4 family protein n=1 Tax=Phocaeicola paurosaccharolyticus TaxID=732242 RepID=UPI0004695E77|nr:NADH-quinone oxidoreductase subunit M [Phocaeicola paurosaccharolyticus]